MVSVWAYVLGMAALFVLVGGYTMPSARDDDHDYQEMLQLQQRVMNAKNGPGRAALVADLQMAEAVYTVRSRRRAMWRLTATTTSSVLLVASIVALFF
ncbi:MAG: hypothetical protein EOO40_10090 [Deltaproteobacteria bacterium]|nr:MAG: hypothetical protein EOO40_10090 [Deltaproteobacteria bacterium]